MEDKMTFTAAEAATLGAFKETALAEEDLDANDDSDSD